MLKIRPNPQLSPLSNPALPGALLVLELASALAVAILKFAPQTAADPDVYWHLAAGEWIAAHRAVPRADPFSWSAAGAAWTAHEWLGELVFYGAFRAGGCRGLALLGASLLLAGLFFPLLPLESVVKSLF